MGALIKASIIFLFGVSMLKAENIIINIIGYGFIFISVIYYFFIKNKALIYSKILGVLFGETKLSLGSSKTDNFLTYMNQNDGVFVQIPNYRLKKMITSGQEVVYHFDSQYNRPRRFDVDLMPYAPPKTYIGECSYLLNYFLSINDQENYMLCIDFLIDVLLDYADVLRGNPILSSLPLSEDQIKLVSEQCGFDLFE